MRLQLALLLPAHFYQDACRISKQSHSFCIAATNEHSLAQRSWSLCHTPSWPHCVCNCTLLVLFQCLVFFFLTVKHQHNEVLLGFGVGISSAKLTHWDISVFSCWQSIYLPSNVEYVYGMNTERRGKMEEGKGVVIAVCAFTVSLRNGPFRETTQLCMDHYTILNNTITHDFEAYFNRHPVNVKTYTKEWHNCFISTLEQLDIFCVCLPGQIYDKQFMWSLTFQCDLRNGRNSWPCPWKSCLNPERKKTPTQCSIDWYLNQFDNSFVKSALLTIRLELLVQSIGEGFQIYKMTVTEEQIAEA